MLGNYVFLGENLPIRSKKYTRFARVKYYKTLNKLTIRILQNLDFGQKILAQLGRKLKAKLIQLQHIEIENIKKIIGFRIAQHVI